MSRNGERSWRVGSSRLKALEEHVERELGVLGADRVTAFVLDAGLGVAVELDASVRSLIKPDALASAVTDAVREQESADPLVVLLELGRLPRSSSGRRQRLACARRWREGTLGGFAAFRAGLPLVTLGAGHGDEVESETERALARIWRSVLRLEQVPRHESFFALGGSSLDVAQVVARVQEELGVWLDLALFFDAPSLSGLARTIERLRAEPTHAALTPIPRLCRRARLPLSHAQRRMHFLSQLEPTSGAYNIAGALRLTGSLDRRALGEAFDALIARHEALRTRFPEAEGEPYQHIDAPYAVTIAEHVRTTLDGAPLDEAALHDAALHDALRAEALAPFDLAEGPLLRVSLWRLASDVHVLAVTLHHAIADGASMNLLLAELATLYAAALGGQPSPLPPLELGYADYAAWQAERLARGEAEHQLRYWREQLGDDHTPLELPADRPRPATPSQRGERVALAVDAALVERARALGRAHDASLFMVLLSAFELLLQRYTGRREPRVGVVVANRLRVEAAGLFGAFVNTQVLSARIDERASFAELLTQTRERVLGAQAHQDLPFEQLVEALEPERSGAHNPLFQVMYNHQPRDLRALGALPGLSAELLDVPQPVTRFDLSLETVEDERGQLSAGLVYASDRFERSRIERLGRHWLELLAEVVAEPGRALRELRFPASLERAELERFSQARTSAAGLSLSETGYVPEQLAARAAARGAATALVSGERALSYAELERQSRALAARLEAAGAGPDVIVAVLLPRSIELVVSVLAILKAGAAYLALDPEHPPARLAYQLEDSGAALVLSEPALVPPGLPPSARVLAFDASDGDAPLTDAPFTAPALHAEQLAYVLYTSGTTGKPKAVGNTHGALAARLAWMAREYAPSERETFLHKTPLTFDVAVWEILLPLVCGARLAIAPPGDHRDPRELARLIQRHGVSTIHFVPSLLRQFVAEAESEGCTSLTRLFSGGEALPAELAQQALARWPGVRLDNRYGPTEALINASYWTCSSADTRSVPIGAAIPPGCLRVLDGELRPTPIGVPGELYIGGGLARGYLGQPGLTAERFVPDPFSIEPGARLYRTGDFARWRADGALEYLGRQDAQVKVRGVRIELGELEAALTALPGVRAAAAALKAGPGGVPRLVAYVVADGALDRAALFGELERRLPAALVPSALVQLERLPLMSSGKLDRAALPEPELERRGSVAPVSALQQRVAAIWQELLGVEELGLDADFFALGGHSLLATQVVSRVRQAFAIELPLRELFEARDLGAFAERVQQARDAGRTAAQPPLVRVERSGPLPLSFAQERMWFLWQLEPQSAAYNVGGAVQLRGALDVAALERALGALAERHEALRTTFPREPGAPVQRIAERASFPFVRRSLGALPPGERESELQRLAEAEASRPFDLEQGPLWRVLLLELEPERRVLVVTLHHIVAEGWAMDVFAREGAALYEAFAAGLPSPLAPLPVQYADYAAWQRRWLEGGEAERQLAFWRRTLGSEHPPLSLASDRPRPAEQTFRGDYHRFRLDRALSARVRDFGVRRGATLSMIAMTALYALLHRHSGERDLRLGYPIANRVRPELEGLIGAFLNTQVLRVEVTPELAGGALLERVKQASLEAQAHQDVPFHRIVEALAPERSAAHTPLFQVMCNVQRWQFQQRRRVGNLELEFLTNDARAAQFDLALDVSEIDGELECALSYSLDLFEPATAERLAVHWQRLLGQIVDQPDRRIGELALSSDAERAALVAAAQGERAPLEHETLHGAFAAQARRSPEAIALIQGERQLSYAQLAARAKAWASVLAARGVGAETVVALCGERSLELTAALLGVLEAGGSYLPLDPEYPAERLAYLLSDSGARLVVSDGSAPALPGVEVLPLDAAREAAARRAPSTHPDQLAYCIYTSGSTGQPKGVGNTHRALYNRLRWMQREYGVSAQDRVLAKTSLGFDVSLGELLWPLISGASVVLAPRGAEKDPLELAESIQRHAVTCVDLVPAQLGALVASGALEQCTSLRLVTVGGEALPPESARAFLERHPAALYNMYGPTEAAVDVAYFRCNAAELTHGVPIGYPEANVALYVLDARLEPVPPLVTGELYIGGVSLARGYLGRPGATAAAFVPDPFAREPGQRLYRTGDLARRRADGALELVGRADAQVKVRGYRIELGEIESRLRQDARVRDVAVIVRRGEGGAQLVGYVEAPGQDAGLAAALKERLRALLPGYMVPAHLVLLDALPRLPSGKLDARALPAPVASEAQDYRAPESALEQRLAAIWSAVLGVPRVGLDDNFFELGGDSIVALTLVHRCREQGLVVSPRQLFQHQTLRALARVVREASASEAVVSRVRREPARGEARLTPIQRRFFAEQGANPNHYNQALLLQPTRRLDVQILERALAAVIEEHASLGLRFTRDEQGEWRQRYAETSDAGDLLWLCRDDSDATLAAECQRAQASLDLAAGPLLRAVLFERGAGEQRLLLVIHHLVVDGVSWRVLVEDLQLAYRQLARGERVALPEPTSSYQQWSEALAEYAHSDALRAELAHWSRAAEAADAVRLPGARADVPLLQRDAAEVRVELDETTTHALLRRTPEAYRTQVNDVLLTALARALCAWCERPAVWLELEGHGREDRLEGLDTSRSVGWFTSLFPVRLAPVAGASGEALGRSLMAVKEQLRALPGAGFGFGVLKELGDAEIRAQLARAPRPRVTFNYLGQLDAGLGGDALFVVASESAGDNRSAAAALGNWLEIEAQVSRGRLSLSFGFSRAMFDEATIAALAERYERELCALIAHCAAPEHQGVTPSDFPLARLEPAALARLPLPAREIEDIYPLSPLQQGLLFHSRYSPEAGLYLSQLSVDAEGLDVERFRCAWQTASDRHEILRTSFWEVPGGAAGDGFVQIVARHVDVDVREVDGAGLAPSELEQAERTRGFDLARAPLSRVLLVRTGARHHRLIWTHHHLLLDGWSSARLMEEVLRTYAGEAPAPKLGRYGDYVAWLLGRDAASDERFWRTALAELAEPTLLASALPRQRAQSSHAELRTSWSAPWLARLSRFAQGQRVTLNTLVQAAWSLLLQRYTGQQTVAFGQTMAGRPASVPGAETTLGLFINTVPVITSPRAESSVAEHLALLQAQQLGLAEHEHTALAELQRWAERPGQPLFDTLLVFENYPLDQALAERGGPGLSFGEPASVDVTSYALTLEVTLGERAGIAFKYDAAAFGEREVRALARSLERLLQQMSEAPERRLGMFALASDEDHALYARANATGKPVRAGYVHEWIAAQVTATPGAVALIQGDVRVSYAQLDARANQLAHHLVAHGVGPDTLVGVCIERSPEMVLGLLAILKAGAAYVPLDPAYPAERLRYMLEDSGCRWLLTSSTVAPGLPRTAAQRLLLDRPSPEMLARSRAALPARTGPRHLAYCIYTSGSTGRPKGVQIEHRGLSNYLGWALGAYRMSELSGSAMHSSVAFDLTVTSLWLPLCAGKSVELCADDGATLEALAATVTRGESAGLLKITPSHALALAELVKWPAPEVRALIVGGEALSWEHVAAIARFAPNGRVVNEYGPTETVVGCCVHDADAAVDQQRSDTVPIGLPIDNTELWVLDSAFQPVPIGVAGELCIAGGSLARGYKGQPGLTAERFVPHPLSAEPGARLYRTGDLARYREDGVLEYLGRIDQQVKIRGYRIELGEIESRLCEHEGVKEASVVARETASGKQLVAYAVASAAAPGDDALSAFLRATLPEYMLPARIVWLPALPLTPNGKLDRKALPAPETQEPRAYAAPESDAERALAGIWQRLLGQERVGRDDNFFDLGGDSIVSLQVVSRAREAGLSLTPRDVFEQQTVAALARVARQTERETPARGAPLAAERLRALLSEQEIATLPAPIEQLEDAYPLSPLQQGMLFHALYEPDSRAYVSQLNVTLEGLDVERFRAAWAAVTARHASLRTSVLAEREGGALQLVWRTAPSALLERDGSDDEATALGAEEHARGFELARAPLSRVVLVRTRDRRHRLIWTYHHLLLDGWSSARLIEEVLARTLGEPWHEPAGRYGDYIAWLAAQDPDVTERFWQRALAPLEEPTLLAAALPRPAAGEGHGEHVQRLDPARSQALYAFAQRERITPSTLIQGAWLLLLARYTGQRTVACGVTLSGRPAALPEVESTLGLFINTLPLIQSPRPELALGDWLRQLQAHNLTLREHEHTPLYDVQRWAGRPGQALFDSLVVFENFPIDRVLRDRSRSELRASAAQVRGATSYALTLEVKAGPELELFYGYARALLDAGRVQALDAHFRALLGQMLDAPSQRLGTLTLTTSEERAALDGWNDTALEYPGPIAIHAAFEQQVARTPEAVALVAGDEVLTYAALNARANQVAARLRTLGVGPDVLVGVCAERSLALVLALYGVLKAGGAYLPLDPESPRERLADMLADSAVTLVLGDERSLSQLPAGAHQTWALDTEWARAATLPATNLPDLTTPENLAYCIYTSGSTGKPKAAGNSHRALHNRLRWMQAEYRLTVSDRVLQKTPYSFDVSVWELFWPLLEGAALVLAPPGAHKDPEQLVRLIGEQRITTLHFVPSMLQAFADAGALPRCPSLRRIMSSGEALPAPLARRVLSESRAALHNLYGPTEAAIDVSYWPCSAGADTESVPIGRPIANLTLHVLDAALSPLPPGVIGELYIGGVGLARGYHRRPGLTAERFVPDAVSGQPGARLYRTGDLARYRADGALEYLGRTDHQVKIRGLRIELGEIEAGLREHAAVRDAVVVARESAGNKQLVGYVAASATGEDAVALVHALRERLRTRLPEYMVPAHLLVLERLPLTASGKVDRKALPAPELARREHVAPEGALEEALATILADVLRLERVGRDDNFFDLGGDSIVSLQVVARARQAGWLLTPRDVFRAQTVAELARAARALSETAAGVTREPSLAERLRAALDPGELAALGIAEHELEDVYALSPMQLGMLFEAELEPDAQLYINQLCATVRGLEVARFRAAWRAVVERHALLRTGFVTRRAAGRAALQLVWRRAEPVIEELDRPGPLADDDALERIARAERARGFKLARPPLQRVLLVRLDDERHELLWTYHHALMDGWSSARLIEEVLARYLGHLPAGEPARYGDYIRWLDSQDAAASEAFWRAELADIDEPTLLASALERPGAGAGYEQLASELGVEATKKLVAFAQAERITVNTLVQGAWALVLAEYTGQRRVVFGAAVAGRPASLPGVESMLGLFINSLPVVAAPRPSARVGEWLRALLERNLALREHEHTPLGDVQRWAGRAGQSLFDTLLVFENYPVDRVLHACSSEHLQFERVATTGATSFPLSIEVALGDRLSLSYGFLREHFDLAQVHELAQRLEQALAELVRSATRALGEIELLRASERAELERHNATAAFFAPGTLHASFEAHAARTPDAIAVIAGGERCTYAALNARANQLARELVTLGVGAETRVGVCLERSLETAVAVLGVLKAGGAYLPLDPDYPTERLAYMLEESRVALVLTREALLERLPLGAARAWCFDRDGAALDRLPSENLAPRASAAQLAYCIFTSGSTGRPKAVGVTHAAIGNRLAWIQREYRLTSDDRLLAKTAFSFDVAVGELFWPLTAGATLVMAPPGAERDPLELGRAIRQHSITVLDFVPSMLAACLDAGELARCPSLRLVTVGAEALPPELARRFAREHAAALYNMYGPTEAAIDVSHWRARGSDERNVPIGVPMANVQLHVLDAALNPVAPGVRGELYIGGDNLARGYLGRPAATAERFVPDPFADEPGKRLYRTGDVARRRADGALEYLGRVDQQVKIRGHRVELGEIEARLSEQPSVREGVVIARPSGATLQLCAYVVPRGDATELPARLREALRQTLPKYMLPAHVVVLERLPLTPSGKLDRKALPESEVTSGRYVAPENDLEEQLTRIFAAALRIERVGAEDNFFELGGDSIVSLQVVTRAREQGLTLSPRDLFEHQTPRALARVAERAQATVIEQGPVTGALELSPIQRRFFAREQPERQRYNQALLLCPVERVERREIERALAAVVAHHDALRLRFTETDGAWRACFADAASSVVVSEATVAPHAIEAAADAAQGGLDLTHGPLVRALLLHVTDGSQRLLLVLHHLVVDGVSWRILLEDLERAFRAGREGKQPELPAKTSSVQRWASELVQHATSEALSAELPYWLHMLEGASAELLPGARRVSDGSNRARFAASASVRLDRATTQALLGPAHAAYRTQVNDLLLGALGRCLCRSSGRSSVVIELEGHGREPLFAGVDVSRTVGWFTSEFPLRLTPVLGADDAALGASIKAIKEQLRAVPSKGVGYAVLRERGDAATRARLQALPGPRLTFNYLGQFDRSFDEGALFTPASEGFGRLQSDDAPLGNELVLTGRVYQGELALSCTYSRLEYDARAIEALLADYRAELVQLIAHTTSGARGVTPSDFPLVRRDQAGLDRLELDWHQVADLYPLSPMQEGLLVHTLLEPGSGIYLMQDLYRIDNELDVERFRRAWQHVSELHPALRTAFAWNDDGMLQVVYERVEAPVDYYDHRELSPEAQAEAFKTLLRQELADGFDLARAPLWRVRLVRTAERAYRFVFSHHHILMDAWSHPLMYQDLSAVYEALSAGTPATRTSPTPYREFIAWLAARDRPAAARYWRAALAGFEQATPLPMGAGTTERGAVSTVGDAIVTLTRAETAELAELASRNKLTMNTLVQAAWALTLVRYSGQRDVLFGVTVAGRPTEIVGLERTIGLFINSIPLRVRLPHGEALTGDWLLELFRQNVAMRQHEHLPLLKIQAESAILRGEPLFHSLFVFENAPEDFQLIASAQDMGAASTGTRTHTNYPLTVVVYPGKELGLHLSYDERFFTHEVVTELLGEWKRLLHALVPAFAKPLSALPIVPPAERTALLETWNATERAYPFEGGYVPLFEQRVQRHPEAVAVACLDERLTFAALNERANRIAHALRVAGVPADSPVALLCERGLALLAGVLGTFKAGAAYLPLDPKHPPRRIADVLAQAQPRAVLTLPAFRALLDEAVAALPEGARPKVIFLESDEVRSAPSHDPAHQGDARSLAYVIFTSGSTGKPKGAMVEHAGMLNNQLSKLPWFGLSETDVIAQTASQCFDISVWQLLTGLLCGARTEIVPDAIAHDPAALLAHVRRTGITVLESVPSLIQAFVDSDEGAPASLRWLIATGEALSPALARRWLARHPLIPIANAYGPAECSDDVSLGRIDAPPPATESFASIGTPTDNNRLHVLDSELELVPAGVIGELCVAGTGVGRGYLADPRRTAERFVPNPYAKTPGERMYRTGDLGRHRADGVLECVGRKDHQVKLRGYRIELGEIEARLCDHAAVADAVVVLRQSESHERLVGYVGLRGEADVERAALASELERHLTASLPDYMVPAQIVVLDALPLSDNGKVDRKALPDPEWSGASYSAPESDVERLLCEVWRDVLGAPRVGIADNFFDLGGDSVVSLQMVSRARQVGITITPRDVFQHQTVQALARVARSGKAFAVEQGPVTGSVPLTPVQAWFFAEPIPERHVYNQGVLLRARQPLDARALGLALEALIAQHDALRLRFVADASGRWQQRHAEPALELERRAQDPVLWQRRASASSLGAQLDAAQASLDLEHGPLLRAALIELDDGSERLLLTAHHLVVDAVSWRVLLADLETAYRQTVRGSAVQLPPKTTSFKGWSERLGHYARGPALGRELGYWTRQLGAASADLPQDRPGAGLEMQHGEDVTLRLDAETTRLLLSEAPQAYRTQVNDLLLTALARTLCRFARTESVLIELEGHGREDLFDDVDLSRTVGWFTSAFPVRLTPAPGDGDAALGDSIKRIKEQLRALPNKGIGFGVLKYLADADTRARLRALPEARVTFNYLGQFDQSFDAEDRLLEPASEHQGRSQSPRAPLDNWLSINGQVYQGELSLTCTYSREMYRGDTVARLMADYERELRALVAHAAGRGVVGLTPSDVVGAQVEQADLDAVLGDLDL